MDIDQRIEALTINIESLHSSVSELYSSVQRHDAQIEALITESKQDGENIRALARIAEIHERRLTDLEDPDGPKA
jgi:hypothetical protein